MTTDPLTWSPISLGRWAGTQVRVHVFLIAFVVLTLLSAALGPEPARVGSTACWLLLLLLALTAHEVGHAAAATWLGGDPEEVRLWPLGNMVGPSPTGRPNDNVVAAVAGPAVNLVLVVVCASALGVLNAQFVWNPFGNPNDSGAPRVAPKVAVAEKAEKADAARTVAVVATAPAASAGKPVVPKAEYAKPYTLVWCVGWFGYLNWVILLANLLPALPFDGGRVFRSYLAQSSIAPGKDSLIPPLLARSCAIILVVVGLVRLILNQKSDGLTLVSLALLIYWMVRVEARMMEDHGFFDDGVFGYDFSEGYTSLESGTAKVRPYRESALKRWRRRRSDLRRQRRTTREAAEDRRMDEILEKIYQQGRQSLTDEEHRFLVRVSAKYRNNKPRAGD